MREGGILFPLLFQDFRQLGLEFIGLKAKVQSASRIRRYHADSILILDSLEPVQVMVASLLGAFLCTWLVSKALKTDSGCQIKFTFRMKKINLPERHPTPEISRVITFRYKTNYFDHLLYRSLLFSKLLFVCFIVTDTLIWFIANTI